MAISFDEIILERATVVLRFGAVYGKEDRTTFESELTCFMDEYFGDEVWLESISFEISEGRSETEKDRGFEG